MSEFKFRTFVMYVVLLVVFLSLINMVFSLHRIAFIGEFLILLFFMLIGLIAILGISGNMRWAWVLLAWLLGFIFADMAFIYLIGREESPYFFYAIAIVIAGFFISLFSIEKEKEDFMPEREKEKILENVSEKKLEKTFKPGKYISSLTGAKFHSPKCDWAKKIKKSNAVWFDNKEDAIKAGYKADNCVK